MKNKLFLFPITTAICVVLLLISLDSLAQSSTVSTRNIEESKWFNSHKWLNGLKLSPHESINKQEFARQYQTNKTWWNEAFNFLKTHNLDSLKTGNYVIDSGNVIASVSELPTKEKEQVNFEAHRNFNDLQYIIKGKAQMGIAPISDPNAKITIPYSDKRDTETFSVSGGEKYYVAEPGEFFIFSPLDIHRPAFKLPGYDVVKKIVIKVRVPKNS